MDSGARNEAVTWPCDFCKNDDIIYDDWNEMQSHIDVKMYATTGMDFIQAKTISDGGLIS